jgi:hypothetical protein
MLPRNSQISVTIAGKADRMDADATIATLRDWLDTLKEIDKEVSGTDSGSIEWRLVAASTSSPLTVTLQPEARLAGDFGPQVVRTYMDGIESLRRGKAPPREFSDRAVSALRRLADRLRDGIGHVTFESSDRALPISAELISTLDRLVSSRSEPVAPPPREFAHEEIGEIEGDVETLASHTSTYFNLWEILTSRRVKCSFPESLTEQVREAWRKRAVASGLIQYGSDGRPQSMVVDSLRLKTPRSLLPDFKDVGIDITGGVESSEYVRGLRGDD